MLLAWGYSRAPRRAGPVPAAPAPWEQAGLPQEKPGRLRAASAFCQQTQLLPATRGTGEGEAEGSSQTSERAGEDVCRRSGRPVRPPNWLDWLCRWGWVASAWHGPAAPAVPAQALRALRWWRCRCPEVAVPCSVHTRVRTPHTHGRACWRPHSPADGPSRCALVGLFGGGGSRGGGEEGQAS